MTNKNTEQMIPSFLEIFEMPYSTPPTLEDYEAMKGRMIQIKETLFPYAEHEDITDEHEHPYYSFSIEVFGNIGLELSLCFQEEVGIWMIVDPWSEWAREIHWISPEPKPL